MKAIVNFISWNFFSSRFGVAILLVGIFSGMGGCENPGLVPDPRGDDFDYDIVFLFDPPLTNGGITFFESNNYRVTAAMTNFRGLEPSAFTEDNFFMSVSDTGAVRITNILPNQFSFSVTNADAEKITFVAQSVSEPKRSESMTVSLHKRNYPLRAFRYPNRFRLLTNATESLLMISDYRSNYYFRDLTMSRLNRTPVTTANLDLETGTMTVAASNQLGTDKYEIIFTSYNYVSFTNIVEVRVSAYNESNGDGSDVGGEIPPVAPEEVPFTVVPVSNQGSQLQVFWTHKDPGADWGGWLSTIKAYRVYYRLSSSQQIEYSVSDPLDARVTNYIISNLSSGSQYDVYLEAENSLGLRSSITKKTVTTYSIAVPPLGPVITVSPYPGSEPALRVEWIPSSAGKKIGGSDAVITNYRIEYRQEGDYIFFSNLGGEATNVIVGQLRAGETFEVRVIAVNDVGLIGLTTESATVYNDQREIENLDLVIGGTHYSNVAFNSENEANVFLLQGASIPNSITASNVSLSLGATSDISDQTLTVDNRKVIIIITAQNQVSQKLYKVTLTKLADPPSLTTYVGNQKWGQAMLDEIKTQISAWVQVSNVLNVPMKWKLSSGSHVISGLHSGIGGVLSLGENEIQSLDTLLGSASQTIQFDLTANEYTYTATISYEPGEIWTWQDLQAVRHNLTGNYRLVRDIIFPSDHSYNFQPIKGNVNNHDTPGTNFQGSLDGKGHIVSNLYIRSTGSSNYIGLFGVVEQGAWVSNIHLRDVKIAMNSQYVGGIAGYNKGSVAGSVIGVVDGRDLGGRTVQYVGGVVGYNSVGGRVAGYVNAEVFAQNYVGGLVGKNEGEVEGFAGGKVVGNDWVGGLVGQNKSQLIGYTTNDVEGREKVGGLVGYNLSGMVYGYAHGDIVGRNYVGGLVGQNNNQVIEVATNDVDIREKAVGLAGDNNTTVKGYFRGTVGRTSIDSKTYFGLTVGSNQIYLISPTNNVATYHSSATGEGEYRPPEIINTRVGVDGTGIDAATTGVNDYSLFQADQNKWIYTANRWPEIRFSDPFLTGAEVIQPTDPVRRR